jgi:hypothetical protein
LHPSVRALRFYYINRKDMKSVGILLKTLGSSLEELHFGDFVEDNAEGQPYRLIAIFMRPHFFMLSAVFNFSNDINLAHNTHLRSLHLKIFNRDVNHLAWVITLLAQITSPYLVHMLLEVDVSLLNTTGINWTGLKNVFNQQRWSNLQEFTVYYYGVYHDGLPERSAARAFIRAQFPVLESRGILQVCV